MKEMFRMAREAGAEKVEGAGGGGGAAVGGGARQAFHGTAFRLGSEEGVASEQVGLAQVRN